MLPSGAADVLHSCTSYSELCSSSAWYLQLDWSLEHPFELNTTAPQYSPLLGSRAIWSVLGINDTYDILRFNVSTNQTKPAVGGRYTYFVYSIFE